MSLNDGSKEVENGESLIYLAARTSSYRVSTTCYEPCVGKCAVTATRSIA